VALGQRVPTDRLFRYIAARTRFFDDQTLSAIAGGAEQIVLVGAGYDGRALRFRSRGVRFFEVDHPATQADKRERVAALGADTAHLTLVPADFVTDDVAVALGAAGHARTAPSLFLCEGVLPYLPEEVTLALLRCLRSVAARGSRLAVDFALRGADGTVAAGEAALDQRVARVGEPIRTRLARGDAVALLVAAGWDDVAPRDIADVDAAITPSRALLVTAGVS
jgi:methyltransferase (TIGR00027 family)